MRFLHLVETQGQQALTTSEADIEEPGRFAFETRPLATAERCGEGRQ